MRIEFQQRGAGHVHGTLWIQLKSLEKLIKHPVRGLVQEMDESCADAVRPFGGIAEAFDKLRTDKELTKESIKDNKNMKNLQYYRMSAQRNLEEVGSSPRAWTLETIHSCTPSMC